MNKAFVREPDQTADCCPRCGSQGQPVPAETLASWLTDEQRRKLANPASFCPVPQCPVVYFDSFEHTVVAADLPRPVYPKDPTAPLCACFGLTAEDIDREVQAGVKTRVREVLEKSQAPGARCRQLAANGRSCAAFVQKYFLQCWQRRNAAGS